MQRKPQPYLLNLLNNNISVDELLAVMLRFLATGNKFQSLEYLFRITRQQISTTAKVARDQASQLGRKLARGGSGEEGSGGAWRQVYQTVNKLM